LKISPGEPEDVFARQAAAQMMGGAQGDCQFTRARVRIRNVEQDREKAAGICSRDPLRHTLGVNLWKVDELDGLNANN
jgi:hypothetical protein